MLVLFWRVLCTRYYEGASVKPLWRNLFLNIWRQLTPALVTNILVKGTGITNVQAIYNDIYWVTVFTLVLQFIPYKTLFFSPIACFWYEIEFKTWMSFGLIGAMNELHSQKSLDGDLITGVMFILLAVPNYRLFWTFIEDLLFQDLNSFNRYSFIFNWLPVFVSVPLIYLF